MYQMIPQMLETIANDVQSGIAFFSPGANTQLSTNPMRISSNKMDWSALGKEIDKQYPGEQGNQVAPQEQQEEEQPMTPEEIAMAEDRLIRALAQQRGDFGTDPYAKARWLNGMMA